MSAVPTVNAALTRRISFRTASSIRCRATSSGSPASLKGSFRTYGDPERVALHLPRAERLAYVRTLSELVVDGQLRRARRVPVKGLQQPWVVQLIRAGIPLRVRAGVEGVEQVERRVDRLRAELEAPADLQLEILRRVVDHLALAARRVVEARQRRAAAEADRRQPDARRRPGDQR